jgi:hypothetical protein
VTLEFGDLQVHNTQAWRCSDSAKRLRHGGDFSALRTGRLHPWYSCLLDAESTPEPEELCQLKIPITQSGIESATFLHVAQYLNQLNGRVPTVLLVI